MVTGYVNGAPIVTRECLCSIIHVFSCLEWLTHAQYHKLCMATLKRTTNMPYTSPAMRIVPISTTPADTAHTRNPEIGNTRDPLQPSDATPSCAARAQDVQNAKVHWLTFSLSTAKMAPAERCDLCKQRHEKACSVACVDRSRARSERLLGRRALVQVAPEDKDADSRKQCSKAFT